MEFMIRELAGFGDAWTGLGGMNVALDINQKFCKGCGICVTFCPKQVLALDERGKIFARDPDKCVSCGQCELRCPDFAIKVVKASKGETNG